MQPKPASGAALARRPAAVAVASNDPAALEAQLDEFSLDILLGLITGSRRSGVLEVDGPRPSLLYFAEGDLCGGESLDDPTLRDALRAADASAGSHPGDLRDMVEDHLITALAATLIPGGATVRFRPGPADAELSRFRFRVPAMLESARARVEAWRVIADVIPSTDLVLHLATDLPPTLDQVLIERTDWQILSGVDGRRTVADLVGRSGRSAFETCSSLYRMIVLGVLEIP